MYLKNLNLINFRNYENQYIEFHKGINVLIGNNGHGKTNVLEAIYLMAIGKSFRTKKDKELISFDKKESYIASNIDFGSRLGKIEIKLGGVQKKAIKVDGFSIEKLGELLGNLKVVIFSPEDLKLIKEGPKERRAFLDREISQLRPKYYSLLVNYNQVLAQRNNLIKSFNPDLNLLDVYDVQLSELGANIFKYRKEFSKKLANIAREIHGSITSSRECLQVEYKTNIIPKDSDNINIAESFLNLLKLARKDDIERRQTLYGIHRDDLDVYLNDLDVKSFGSQGQQRSASISLKLSEIQLIYEDSNEYPILLLDDIFSELDQGRQRLLIDKFKDIQVFITTAEKSHLDTLEGLEKRIFNVEKGTIRE